MLIPEEWWYQNNAGTTVFWCQRSFGSGDTQWQPTRRPTQRYEKEITTEELCESRKRRFSEIGL
jgi:hypothetical protein